MQSYDQGGGRLLVSFRDQSEYILLCLAAGFEDKVFRREVMKNMKRKRRGLTCHQ
jgi:hypothetical protein